MKCLFVVLCTSETHLCYYENSVRFWAHSQRRIWNMMFETWWMGIISNQHHIESQWSVKYLCCAELVNISIISSNNVKLHLAMHVIWCSQSSSNEKDFNDRRKSLLSIFTIKPFGCLMKRKYFAKATRINSLRLSTKETGVKTTRFCWESLRWRWWCGKVGGI